MKINEVLIKENLNKKFKDSNGDVWVISESEMPSSEKLTLRLANSSRMPITSMMELYDILKLDFELIGENINTKIQGINRKLFLELAFCEAFKIEFNQDLYNLMENLEYNDENYVCFQDVVRDEKLRAKLKEYAQRIRKYINSLD